MVKQTFQIVWLEYFESAVNEVVIVLFFFADYIYKESS